MEAALRPRLRPARFAGASTRGRAVYSLGRLLQVTGLLITLVAGTAFFGSTNITAMLRMMVVGVCFFLPGWLLARKGPR